MDSWIHGPPWVLVVLERCGVAWFGLASVVGDPVHRQAPAVGELHRPVHRHTLVAAHGALVGADDVGAHPDALVERSAEHTSELQSLMRISYAVFCLKQKTNNTN